MGKQTGRIPGKPSQKLEMQV